MEYRTRYPRTVSFLGSARGRIDADPKTGVAQLELVVGRSIDDLYRIFASEGFRRVSLEHRRPGQVGHGLCLKLAKPWELHVRMTAVRDGLVAIHSEVEVSRDYLQHAFSQRTHVIYEVAEVLQRHRVEYRIWSRGLRRYVSRVFDDYRVRLAAPAFPAFAWKPMIYAIATVGAMYLWKYLNTI